MYYFTRLSHIVDGFILPAGMRVWVVCTHTHTRLPDGYMMLPIYVPAGRNIIPYPSPYRVKPVGYSGFGYPLPSLGQRVPGGCGMCWVGPTGIEVGRKDHGEKNNSFVAETLFKLRFYGSFALSTPPIN
jgi:hypothetical protein